MIFIPAEFNDKTFRTLLKLLYLGESVIRIHYEYAEAGLLSSRFTSLVLEAREPIKPESVQSTALDLLRVCL